MQEEKTRNEIILKLYKKGFRQFEIAKMLDVSRQRVNQIIKKDERKRINKK